MVQQIEFNGSSLRTPENRSEAALPIIENLRQIRSHQESLGERSADHPVLHVVPHESSVIAKFKGVLVNPGAIGASYLSIDEPEWWFPRCNFALPAQRNSVNAE